MEELGALHPGFNDRVNRAWNHLHRAFWSQVPAPASAPGLRDELPCAEPESKPEAGKKSNFAAVSEKLGERWKESADRADERTAALVDHLSTKTFSDGATATGLGPLPDLSPGQQDASVEQLIQSKGKTAPRVTPDDIEANIASEHYFTAAEGVAGEASLRHHIVVSGDVKPPAALGLLTFCVLVLRNGFTVTGESACASPENFDAEIGRRIARENAVQKVWPLMGYALKQRLHDAAA
ncbi:hypothetical protein C4F17_12260 [Variovorax sp. PMC12]|nr:hypothetical protein C4F17_12260 [Variovorax sp. PMC12]